MVKVPAVAKRLGETSTNTGGWIKTGLLTLRTMSEVSSIAIVTVYNGKDDIEFIEDEVHYYLVSSRTGIFKFDRRLSKKLEKILEKFVPNIVDIHGAEFFFGKSMLEVCRDIPVCITLQGLSSEISKWYYAGISPYKLAFFRTIKDNLMFDGVFERQLRMKSRGRNEKEILKKVKYVLGRTEWDRANSLKHNPQLKFYSSDRILREPFYHQIWDINAIERYSIFTIQSTYPLKGLHLLLDAVRQLLIEFPRIKLYIPGKNMISRSTLFEKITFGNYQKYLAYLIDKYNLESNIVFLGSLNDAQVAERLSRSHVFVLPSVLENSPNSLAEAQIVGTPSVAAFVGGVPKMVEDNVSGLLYNCFETAILAEKIRQIFNNDVFAVQLSKNARRKAFERHSQEKNGNDIVKAYTSIIECHKNEI